MQQILSTDLKAIMYSYFPPTRYERDYTLWLGKLNAGKNANCLSWNIYYRNN